MGGGAGEGKAARRKRGSVGSTLPTQKVGFDNEKFFSDLDTWEGSGE